jgi:hydroxymethylpyrimidine/phosphomethylpyrimidine kinase
VSSVLLIAGSDSSGGAGLTRDVETLTRLGVEARCAVTAVTAQSVAGFRGTHLMPPQWVSAQITAALADGLPGAIKIGMLGDAAIVRAVAAVLPPRAAVPVVLDPVFAASSGGELLDAAGREALRTLLLPQVTLLTPNIPEAALLLRTDCAATPDEQLQQAQQLLQLGCAAVLLKGGHALGAESSDVLVQADAAPLRLNAPRRSRVRRGTGCTLASAIAAELARGATLPSACARAKEHLLRFWLPAS